MHINDHSDPELLQEFKSLSRHLVTLSIAYKHLSGPEAGLPRSLVCSCFIVEVDGVCLLVTACHIVAELEKGLRKKELELVEPCYIDDRYHLGADTDSTIPFNYDDTAKWWEYDRSTGIDYAALQLSGNARDLLLAHGALHVVDGAWKDNQLDGYDCYLIAGFPEDSTESDVVAGSTSYTLRSNAAPTFVSVDYLAEKPGNEAAQTEHDQFFGTVDSEVNKNLKGTSGGPIIGCKFQEDGVDEYRVLALQGWQLGGVIGGCPLHVFMPRLIERINQGKVQCEKSIAE